MLLRTLGRMLGEVLFLHDWVFKNVDNFKIIGLLFTIVLGFPLNLRNRVVDLLEKPIFFLKLLSAQYFSFFFLCL